MRTILILALFFSSFVSGYFVEHRIINKEIDVLTTNRIKISENGFISYPPSRPVETHGYPFHSNTSGNARIVSLNGATIDQQWPDLLNNFSFSPFSKDQAINPEQSPDAIFVTQSPYGPPSLDIINRVRIRTFSKDGALVAEASYWQHNVTITVYDASTASIIQKMEPLPEEAGQLLALSFFENEGRSYLAAFAKMQTYIWQQDLSWYVKSATTAMAPVEHQP